MFEGIAAILYSRLWPDVTSDIVCKPEKVWVGGDNGSYQTCVICYLKRPNHEEYSAALESIYPSRIHNFIIGK